MHVTASFITGITTITFDESKVTVDQIIDEFHRTTFRVMGRPEMIQ